MVERGLTTVDTRINRDPFKPELRVIEGGLKSMPAGHIPVERGRGHLHLKSVAEHEARHAVVTIDQGQGMVLLTIKRNGNTLGSVTPAKTDSVAAFQITAMASSVDKHPSGTGSDVYKAKMLANEPGGISVNSAFSAAQGIVMQKSDLQWDTLGDIVAFEGQRSDITESEFKELEKRADWEVEMIEKYGRPIPLFQGGDIFVEDEEKLAA